MLVSILIVLLGFSFSCGDASNEMPYLKTIEISSTNGNRFDLAGPEIVSKLTVNGFDQFGDPFELPGAINWTVDNDNLTVDATGNLTAIHTGKSVITAMVGAVKRDYPVTLWDSEAPRTEIFVSDAGNYNQPPWQILRVFADGSHQEIFTKENLG